jgi:transcription antitermination protein NusB
VAARRPSRKQARRDAAFVLYQHEVTGRDVEELLADVKRSEGYAADEFTRACVAGVCERRDGLDATIAAHARGWTLERLAPLEHTILRLALWEIESGVTPPEVAIDEAVRLARRYSTDEAGAFVNGVLAGALGARRGRAEGGDAAAAVPEAGSDEGEDDDD